MMANLFRYSTATPLWHGSAYLENEPQTAWRDQINSGLTGTK